MSSAKASFLPTSVSVFIDYLNGKPSSAYDGSGENLLRVLCSAVEGGLRQQYDEFRSRRMKERKEVELIRDIDVVNFLISVLPSVFGLGHPGPLQTTFNQLSKTSYEVLFEWFTAYRKSELDPLEKPSSQSPQFEIFSKSSVRPLLHSLLEGSRTSRHIIDDRDFAQKCNEIKDAILSDLLEYLRRLSIDEATAKPQSQRSSKRSTPEGEVVTGHQNQQDAISQAIQHSEWFGAWEDKFRGSALENLEVKLSLNVQALRTSRDDKIGMSRIVPIVQSSGTGKSRLAEQYTANKILG